MLENNKFQEYKKAAKENSAKFNWIEIIKKYKEIL
jgi:phosphatidylinositol alpha-1,6-mannosyltransferase